MFYHKINWGDNRKGRIFTGGRDPPGLPFEPPLTGRKGRDALCLGRCNCRLRMNWSQPSGEFVTKSRACWLPGYRDQLRILRSSRVSDYLCLWHLFTILQDMVTEKKLCKILKI